MAVRLSPGATEGTPDTAAHGRGPASVLSGITPPTGFARLRRDLRTRRWGDLHRRLAAQPVFAACSRQEIRFVARWVDEVRTDGGCLLWHEGTIGLHFVVVEAGELVVMRKGHRVRALGAGEYAGDQAILGWGPQPGTLRTATPCRLFVIGRAALLSLVHMPGVRTGLLGVLAEDEARVHIRALRAAGLSEWKKRPPSHREVPALRTPSSLRFYPPATHAPTDTPARPDAAVTHPAATPRPMSRRGRMAFSVGIAAAVLIPAGVASETVRPHVGVVSPARPIDVSGDVSIIGATATPIRGHFILTAVRIHRPTYAQWVPARLRHDTTVPLASDQRAAAQASRHEFAEAKRHAVSAAESALTLDPAKLRVAMHDLDVSGSSAGLIYALAIADALDPADLAGGRTIAATGQIDASGRVSAVSFVAEKARVARAAGATLFLVPPGQAVHDDAMRVVEVATLADALAVLRAMNG